MSSPFAQELAAKRSLSRRALPAGWPPRLSDAELVAALEPPAPGVRVRAVLDTDTFNEIDDQFAIVQLLLSPERVDLRAIYAAPFFNDRAVSSVDGMEKSYEEILRLLARMGVDPAGLVHRGSCQPLQSWASPEPSEAATDLVIAIGAITNVASALLLDPRIARRVVVVWLGGHANGWAHTLEYNLQVCVGL
jgi:inosine-uridine nucleoside N-ribohydrolase